MEKFISNVSNLYEAIVIASKRARQIHDEIKIELRQRIETLNQLSTTTEAEDEMDTTVNPDQLKISLEFEQREKPTDVALRELTSNQIEWRYKEPEEPKIQEKEAE
jgi:DNA-directed RNA polymerase subunit K/omega